MHRRGLQKAKKRLDQAAAAFREKEEDKRDKAG
jgi:hypothetical protein